MPWKCFFNSKPNDWMNGKKCFSIFTRFIASSRANELWLCEWRSLRRLYHPITASECVVIGFEAKLVIFIARLIIIQYCTECFYVSLAIHHDGSVSAHILLSWENKLSVAFEWDSLTCRNMFFIDFFSAFILALNRVRRESQEALSW